MIFGRKNKTRAAESDDLETPERDRSEDLAAADEEVVEVDALDEVDATADEPESVEPESVEPESVEPESVEPESVEPESVEEEQSELDHELEEDALSDDAEVEADEDQLDQWAELDLGEHRAEGPFDIDEVDLTDDPITRLDLGALIITPFQGAELRLNVMENTRNVVSVLMAKDNSALEIAVFAAPSSGGMWTEMRQRVAAETEQAGGRVTLAEGPFGTELRTVMPAKGPNGEDGFRAMRTWMAQGPRWALRGVVHGRAAVSGSLDEAPLDQFFDAFRDVIVRRGDGPQRAGEILPMTVPDNVAAPQQAGEAQNRAD